VTSVCFLQIIFITTVRKSYIRAPNKYFSLSVIMQISQFYSQMAVSRNNRTSHETLEKKAFIFHKRPPATLWMENAWLFASICIILPMCNKVTVQQIWYASYVLKNVSRDIITSAIFSSLSR